MSRVTEIERQILTSLGRLLKFLAESGGAATQTHCRKAVGSQYYTALHKGTVLGLIVFHPEKKVVELTAKGKKIADCLKECFSNI